MGKTDEAVRCYKEARTLYAKQEQVVREAAEKSKIRRRPAPHLSSRNRLRGTPLAEAPKKGSSLGRGYLPNTQPASDRPNRLESKLTETRKTNKVAAKIRRRGTDTTMIPRELGATCAIARKRDPIANGNGELPGSSLALKLGSRRSSG